MKPSPRGADGRLEKRTRHVLGIPFLINPVEEAVQLSLRGGLVVVPAAPPLAQDLLSSPAYRNALLRGDFVLPDSGAMVLGWNLRSGFARSRRMARLSGLKFLIALLEEMRRRPDLSSFWVMPSAEDLETNLRWLRTHGFPSLNAEHCYVAPTYSGRVNGRVEDTHLLERLEASRPDIVVINLGGGTQELLGVYLKESLSYSPTIVCTGAAIAFLTGRQARIPHWADRLYLGWAFRIAREPGKFGPRYLGAFRLFLLLAVHGERDPCET
jgi:UDP-N-acetyl-D-mannosaminuronic acid transferase (WecB/TagA/CpsF family)